MWLFAMVLIITARFWLDHFIVTIVQMRRRVSPSGGCPSSCTPSW